MGKQHNRSHAECLTTPETGTTGEPIVTCSEWLHGYNPKPTPTKLNQPRQYSTCPKRSTPVEINNPARGTT